MYAYHSLTLPALRVDWRKMVQQKFITTC